jgi:hypothetical protein
MPERAQVLFVVDPDAAGLLFAAELVGPGGAAAVLRASVDQDLAQGLLGGWPLSRQVPRAWGSWATGPCLMTWPVDLTTVEE